MASKAYKSQFLEAFSDFLEDCKCNKCYFKLTNDQECQGWISDINEDFFVFLDSGPLARDEPYVFQIKDIDTDTFAYWDGEAKKWIEYVGPNEFEILK